MAVVQSFPLFNLPYLPLYEVMSYMDPIDLFLFSVLSEKTTKLVKESHTLDLEVTAERSGLFYNIVCKNQNGSNFLTISVENMFRPIFYQGDMVLQNPCGTIKCSKSDDNSIITYWKDVFEGFKKMLSFVSNQFKIRNLSIEFLVNAEKLRKTIEHIQKLQSELKITLRKLKIGGYLHHSNMIKYILEKFSDVPELIMNSSEIKYKFYKDQPDEDSYLVVRKASWLTFDAINLVTKFKKIKLWDLQWNSQEMNQFLKMWNQSSMMQNVELFVENADIPIALEGLSVKQQSKYMSFLGSQPRLSDCFEIQRKDGVKTNIWSFGKTSIMETFQ